MKIVKSNIYNKLLQVKMLNALDDILMDTETIDGIKYDIYLKYCGNRYLYAVEIQ